MPATDSSAPANNATVKAVRFLKGSDVAKDGTRTYIFIFDQGLTKWSMRSEKFSSRSPALKKASRSIRSSGVLSHLIMNSMTCSS